MVLAAMVEHLFSDQNLIDVIPRNPRSDEMIVNRYSSILRAIAIVGSSVANRAKLADALSKVVLDPRGSGSVTRSPTKVRNDHLSFSIDRRAWGDGTREVVIGARPGADPRTNQGRGAPFGVGVAD
jgi:hypothetical protein